MMKLANGSRVHDESVAYRLLATPVLREQHRSAKILGALARMELGPVTAAWFARRTGLRPQAALALLEDICAQGCARKLVIPSSEGDSGLGEISQTPASDLVGLEDVHRQPPTRLRSAYEFLRRVL